MAFDMAKSALQILKEDFQTHPCILTLTVESLWKKISLFVNAMCAVDIIILLTRCTKFKRKRVSFFAKVDIHVLAPPGLGPPIN